MREFTHPPKFQFYGTMALGQKSTFHPKIHILKIPIFTQFTFLKSHFSQNSPFWNLIFLPTKFTFLKPQFSQHLGNLTVWCLSFPPDLFNFLIWKGLVVLILLIYIGFFWHFLKILTIQLCLFPAFWRVFFNNLKEYFIFSRLASFSVNTNFSPFTFVYFQRFDEFFPIIWDKTWFSKSHEKSWRLT